MERAMAENSQNDNFISISAVLDELERDLLHKEVKPKEKKTHPNKEAILKVLSKAADDHNFLARLAEDPAKVLKEYELTSEERAALASGDLRRIESWVGKLDKRLSTWIWCRLQQEKW
ncbi:MAG: hypothetical protein KAS25_01465 [Dehalococcoidales bacterium]|nr:hypothetical protein [Dehalococcoidales bacterium]